MKIETAVVADTRQLLKMHLEQLLEDLVQAESVNPPGNEAVAAEALAEYLKAVDLDSHLQTFETDRMNLVAPARSWNRPARLALCGHLDVVPPGPQGEWSSPPFTITRAGDRLVGRGVCDDKGPLAVMALVVAAFERNFPGQVALAAVAGEEAGGVGSRELLQSGFRAGAVIIGEPTGLRTARAHKGRVEAKITINGVGGHAAMGTARSSAISILPKVIDLLERLSDGLSSRPPGVCGTPTLAVTQIHSAKGNAATVPSAITLTVDRRLAPGEMHEACAAQIKAALSDLQSVTVEWRAGASPCELVQQHPLVVAATTADPQGAESIGLSATCDQYIWDEAGIPGIILGPGDLLANRAHAADEHINLSDLLDAGERYAHSIVRYLQGAGR